MKTAEVFLGLFGILAFLLLMIKALTGNPTEYLAGFLKILVGIVFLVIVICLFELAGNFAGAERKQSANAYNRQKQTEESFPAVPSAKADTPANKEATGMETLP